MQQSGEAREPSALELASEYFGENLDSIKSMQDELKEVFMAAKRHYMDIMRVPNSPKPLKFISDQSASLAAMYNAILAADMKMIDARNKTADSDVKRRLAQAKLESGESEAVEMRKAMLELKETLAVAKGGLIPGDGSMPRCGEGDDSLPRPETAEDVDRLSGGMAVLAADRLGRPHVLEGGEVVDGDWDLSAAAVEVYRNDEGKWRARDSAGARVKYLSRKNWPELYEED